MGTIRPFAHLVQTKRLFTPEDMLRIVSSQPGAVLLESSYKGSIAGWGVPFSPTESPRSRWCIASGSPVAVLSSRNGRVTLTTDQKAAHVPGTPLDALSQIMESWKVPEEASVPFTGGMMGFLGYDFLRPSFNAGDRNGQEPAFWLGLYEAAMVLDLNSGQLWLTGVESSRHPGRARAKADEYANRVHNMDSFSADHNWSPVWDKAFPHSTEPMFAVDRSDYMAMVNQAIEAIRSGRLFQVNLSQRLSVPSPIPFESIYLLLRGASPAPFGAYMRMGEFGVASASPERFVLTDAESRVQMRPIKGTRPRGARTLEDNHLAGELWRSEKDAAELAMIVDDHRGDLGAVCEYGSIRVVDERRLETFPQVHHTVATIEGRTRPEVDVAQLLRAVFPAGSVTGAPKAGAIQLIGEMEPVHRGVYTGAIGYMGFDGRTDLSVAVRTAVLRGNILNFHIGGGIVADSDPADEYDETLAKASGFLKALRGETYGGHASS